MASASENQTHQGDDSKEITLIDIFYCDDDRLNSLTSQVFHGSIQEVLETIENSKTEKVTNRANVGFLVRLVLLLLLKTLKIPIELCNIKRFLMMS